MLGFSGLIIEVMCLIGFIVCIVFDVVILYVDVVGCIVNLWKEI